MSNIIKSTRVSISSGDKYSVEVPVIDNAKFVTKDIEEVFKLKEEPINNLTHEAIIKLAEEDAREIIKQAEEDAQVIISQANSDAEIEAQKILEDAQNDGYNFGYNKAIEEVNLLKSQVQKELQLTIAEKKETLEAIEPEVIKMVLQISKSIFDKMLDINPQTILLLMKKGLSQASTSGKIFIHISKYEYDIAYENISELQEFVGGRAELELLKDLSLDKGDCIIETQFGNIDCSFEQQFESIKKEMIYILENR